jgi:PAS domain S-box-containing protein
VSTNLDPEESTELWRTTLDSIGDAVITTDTEGLVTFLNPVAEQLTGWSLADARGVPLTEVFRIVNETTREPVDNPALRALRTGTIVGLANHTILISRDGAEYPIDDSAAPIRRDGRVGGAVLVFRDISERKAAEAELARANAETARQKRLYETILSATPDFVYVFSLDHKVLYANDSLVAMWGAGDPVGKTFLEIGYPAWHAEMHDREIDQVRATKRPIRGEVHFIGTLGRREYDYIFVPVFGADGEVEAVAGTTRDVTDRRAEEEKLRLLDALGEAVRPAADPVAVLEATTRLLGEHLKATRIAYADLEPDNDGFTIRHDWRVQGVASTVGTYSLDAFGPRAAADLRAGRTLVVRDVDAELAPAEGGDTFNSIGIKAIVCCPLVKSGRLVAMMAAHQDTPRAWTPGEVAAVEEAVERSWAHVERVGAAAAVRESDDRFRIVARATNDAVWDWDMRTDAVWWNEGVTALFGHRREDVGADASWWYEMIHPDDRERVVDGIHAVIDHGGAHWSAEYRFRRADGTYATILDRGYAIHEGGRTIRLVGAMQDVTERRRTEERLRESEQRFRSLFESMDEGYCLVEPLLDADGRAVDYRYLMANPALQEQTGMVDVVGRTAREVMPSHESHWIEGYARVAETGEPYRSTGWVADLGRWYDVSAFLVGPPGSGRVGVLFDDISDRKRAEALLREKDERLKLLVDQARDYAVVVTDRDGKVLEWSGGAEGITGFAPAEILGRPADVFFTPEDRAAGVPAREMEVAAREGRAEDKRWHLRKDGGQFFADGVMVPLRGDDGALHGFGKVFRDITNRKRAEESVRFLADASASLAELVDYQSTLNRIANLAVGGFADWCVVDMIGEDGERERLAVTAAESEEVSSARDADASLGQADSAAEMVPHVLRSGEPEVVYDVDDADLATAPQGAERLARLREVGIRSYLCVPLLSRGRVIGGMTFLSTSARRRFGVEEQRVAQSLAERVTVAIENAQLYRTLQEQDRRKDEFLATLAHELRNPLAPVRNGLQILRLVGTDGERTGNILSMMDRQLRHITHLVDDLMDVARVSSGKVALRMERMPLRAIVDAAVETSRQTIEAGGHEFALKLPREDLAVEADRTRMVQVLANLLNNAAKYTPPEGRIVLGVKRDGGHAVVRVADTGLGIPQEMLPRVFEMFTQVGTSLERSQGGLGIGLTLVKRLVEMHGGTVSAESAGPGQGSVFTVRIPLAEEVAPPPGALPDESAGPAGPTLDILVVDDNRDSADTLARLLGFRGHRVKAAHDGPEALRLLASYRPQLILLDLGLPGMSGYEVARRIRESMALRGVTLAALTGWGQDEDRRRTREAGFDFHLVKPADTDEIDRIVRGIEG